jgi:hypothetical protein
VKFNPVHRLACFSVAQVAILSSSQVSSFACIVNIRELQTVIVIIIIFLIIIFSGRTHYYISIHIMCVLLLSYISPTLPYL